MVLVGALTVGDSVRATLSALADERIGHRSSLARPRRLFREELSNEIQEELGTQSVVAPIVITRGTISSPDGSVRVNVDSKFSEWRSVFGA